MHELTVAGHKYLEMRTKMYWTKRLIAFLIVILVVLCLLIVFMYVIVSNHTYTKPKGGQLRDLATNQIISTDVIPAPVVRYKPSDLFIARCPVQHYPLLPPARLDQVKKLSVKCSDIH